MLPTGWLEGDGGEEKRGTVGKVDPTLIQEGSLENFTPLGPVYSSGALGCLLGSFTKNTSHNIFFCFHFSP